MDANQNNPDYSKVVIHKSNDDFSKGYDAAINDVANWLLRNYTYTVSINALIQRMQHDLCSVQNIL